MDSGLGSDEDRRGGKTKEQKQLRNQQLLSGCFIDASSLSDDSEVDQQHLRRNNERRQGALIFNSSIPHYSMLQMSSGDNTETADSTTTTTPFNSIVQIENQEEPKAPLGFYVDLNDVDVETTEEATSTSMNKTKNIFSFVVDFEAPKKEKPATLRKRASANKMGQNGNGKFLGGESCSGSGSSLNSLPGPSTNTNADNDGNEGQEETKIKQNGNFGETRNTQITAKVQQTFVKLSDLECQKTQTNQIELNLKPRMSRSIPESSWIESPLMMMSRSGYRSGQHRPHHPLEPDPSEEELYDSFSSSQLEQFSAISRPKKSARRLGTDLLRMFLEEIGPDVTIEVEDHKIKAHKCILASRCQYFAALLSGNWLEDSGNIISLTGFSYEAVYFSLCHIYSGAAHVPDSISVIELASLADMLGLEGLKEVVEHSLRVRHCHNFHKPCPGCSGGVVEVLMLAAAYGLDELYQKSMNWIGQHFVKIWPTKGFSTLPRELREKCYQFQVANLSPEKVLEMQSNCEKILASLQGNGSGGRWIEPVQVLVQRLIEACRGYHIQHYSSVLVSPSFIALDSGPSWCVLQVEDQMLSCASSLSIEQACKSYSRCSRMLSEESVWTAPFGEMLGKIKTTLEQCLVAQSARLGRSNAWLRLDSHLRARIKSLNGTQENIRSFRSQGSSDSSQHSSPGFSQNRRSDLSASGGSPSLRRSLLLAAKSPQIPLPSSVSSSTRKSTLTQPTAASAAKSAQAQTPTKVKSLNQKTVNSNMRKVENSTKRIIKKDINSASSSSRLSSPVKTLKSPSIVSVDVKKQEKDEKCGQILPKMNLLTRQRMQKAAAVAANTRPNTARKTEDKTIGNVQKRTNIRPATSSRIDNNKVKNFERKPNNKVDNAKKIAPVMQRSDTFLKEEPTVIGKL